MYGDLEAFKREFSNLAALKRGVVRVHFAGSMGHGDFIPGRSDADILVYGDVSLSTRLEIYDLLWELNYKYQLGLEGSPLLHPPIVFVDTLAERAIVEWLKKQGNQQETLRASLKRVAPRTGRLIELYQRARRRL